MIVCKNCGTRNAEDRRWCSRCETFLDWDGQQVDVAAPTVAPVMEAEVIPRQRRKVWPIVVGVLAVLVVVGAVGAFLATRKGSSSASTAVKISNVTFTSGSVAPGVTVTGSGFGSTAPPPSPAQAPTALSKSCGTSTGDDGYDYGATSLSLANQTKGWRAGSYSSGDVSCIGLIVRAWSPTQIVFDLGGVYTKYVADNKPLAAGDHFVVTVLGKTYEANVSYGG